MLSNYSAFSVAAASSIHHPFKIWTLGSPFSLQYQPTEAGPWIHNRAYNCLYRMCVLNCRVRWRQTHCWGRLHTEHAGSKWLDWLHHSWPWPSLFSYSSISGDIRLRNYFLFFYSERSMQSFPQEEECVWKIIGRKVPCSRDRCWAILRPYTTLEQI